MRYCTFFEFTTAQVTLLLEFVKEDMANKKQAVALLKAIVSRKVLLPEVYDVITRVCELMVQSNETAIRTQSAAVFLQFLMDYPLGPTRLQQHLGFLVNNARHPRPSARKTILELLNAIIIKFPQEVLDDNAS